MVPIYIGTAGWSIPKQHAAELPQTGTHLERYSQIFSCAEINSSFYRSHRVSTWENWAASVPENFRFSVKAPKAITHEAKLHMHTRSAQRLPRRSENPRQQTRPNPLPASSQVSSSTPQSPNPSSICFAINTPAPPCFEPRHPTWFTAEANHLLQRFHIARAATDPARVPAAATAGGDSQLLYCRLHGSPAHVLLRLSGLLPAIPRRRHRATSSKRNLVHLRQHRIRRRTRQRSHASTPAEETRAYIFLATTSLPTSYRSPPAPAAP